MKNYLHFLQELAIKQVREAGPVTFSTEADVDVSGQLWRSGLTAILHCSDQRLQVSAQPGGGL